MSTFILLALLGLCVLVQLYFAFYYFLPLARFKSAAAAPSHPVSVIVAAHNELGNLAALLPLLLDQAYPEFEIILVNDRSSDDTAFYTYELEKQFVNFRVIEVKKTPDYLNAKKYALTLGVRAARHEHLLFTDADCRPNSANWMAEMQQGYASGADLVLGYSPYLKTKGFLNHLIRYETLLTGIQYLSLANKGHAYMGVGRNLSYTKALFFKNKGFASHIRTTGGDDDLFVRDASNKSNISIVVDKEAQTSSIPKKTFGEWVAQKRRHLAVGNKYKPADKIRIGTFVAANVFFYLFSAVLVLSHSYIAITGLLIGLRYFAIFPVYVLAARRLGDTIARPLLPLLDAVYFFNYLFLGVSVLMYKKIRWK